MRTALSTLLTFWPPAPPDRIVLTSRSAAGISTSASASSRSSGISSTPAKLVCRLFAALNGESRTRRWVPRSERSSPYAYSPSIVSVADLIPASSPSVRSVSVARAPGCRSAHRVYIRSSISAQSCASTPPEPARTVRTAPHASCSPSSSARRSHAPSSPPSASSAASASGSSDSSASASASASASSIAARASSSATAQPAACSSDARRSLSTRSVSSAWSASSQKSGADERASSSSTASRIRGRSSSAAASATRLRLGERAAHRRDAHAVDRARPRRRVAQDQRLSRDQRM